MDGGRNSEVKFRLIYVVCLYLEAEFNLPVFVPLTRRVDSFSLLAHLHGPFDCLMRAKSNTYMD